MNLIDFIRMSNGLDDKNMPKSTAIICLVEMEEGEEDEVVSNIKQMLPLLTPEIKIDYFADGCDENGYVEVRFCFKNPNSSELRTAWNMLEEYRNLNSFDDIPIDADVAIETDTMIEVMIVPKETSETDLVFLELAFPINFTISSSAPGRIADSLDLFFNANSCRFHENDYLNMEELNKETDNYIRDLEHEQRKAQEDLAEQLRQEEENKRKQMERINQSMDKAESVHRIRIGGNANENEESDDM